MAAISKIIERCPCCACVPLDCCGNCERRELFLTPSAVTAISASGLEIDGTSFPFVYNNALNGWEGHYDVMYRNDTTIIPHCAGGTPHPTIPNFTLIRYCRIEVKMIKGTVPLGECVTWHFRQINYDVNCNDIFPDACDEQTSAWYGPIGPSVEFAGGGAISVSCNPLVITSSVSGANRGFYQKAYAGDVTEDPCFLTYAQWAPYGETAPESTHYFAKTVYWIASE